MTEDKSKPDKTGKTVRDTKGTEEKKPAATDPTAQNRVQVHQGNIPVLTIQFLSEISIKLGRIATALEKANG